MDARARDLRQLLRNFIGLGVGNYGAMVVSLLITAILTRRLGKDLYGGLTLLLMASNVVSLLVANWTQMGVVRFGAVEFKSTGSVAAAVWTRVWIAGPWAVVATLLIAALRAPLAAYLQIPVWGLALVLAHFFAAFVLTTIGAAFQAQERMRHYGVVLFFDKAVMIALILTVPVDWARHPLTLLGMYAGSSLFVALWGIVALGRKALTPVTFDRQACRTMLSFSLPLILSSWAGLLGTTWVDSAVITRFLPRSDVGLYGLGGQMAAVVQQVTIIFSTLLLPQFSLMVAEREHEKIATFVDRVLPYWFLGLSVLLCLVVLLATPVVPLVFGVAFAGAVPVLVLMALATCALALFNAFSPLVVAFGSTWMLTAICLVSGASNVVFDFALIPRYGIAGAAFATVLSYSVSAVSVLVFVQTRVAGRVTGLAWLGLPVAIVCLCFFLLQGWLFYLLAIPAGAVSVFGLVSRFRLFRAEDAVYLQGLRLPASLVGRAP